MTGKIEAILTDRPVAYHPILAKVLGGVKPALFISQLMYWTPRARDKNGWIFKSANEFEEELGMTRREQETARKILVAKGVLRHKVKGVPPVSHYQIDFARLEELLPDGTVQFRQKRQIDFDESAKSISTKAPNPNRNTETTAEITAETTNIGADKPRRVRDALFDAIVECCGVDPATAGSSIGKVKTAMLKASPPYTPEEIRKWRAMWPAWKDSGPTLWQLKEQIGTVRNGSNHAEHQRNPKPDEWRVADPNNPAIIRINQRNAEREAERERQRAQLR